MAKTVYSEINTIRVCVAFIAMQNTTIRLCLKYPMITLAGVIK